MLARGLLLGVVWWALVEGDAAVLGYGLVLVPLAVATSVALVPPAPSRGAPLRRGRAAVGLLGWFLWQSLLGGADVGRRAVRRPVDLDPGLEVYPWRTADPTARVLVAGLNGLMPGTLSVDLEETCLRLHVLDRAVDTRAQLAELERRVAAVLGVPLEDAGPQAT